MELINWKHGLECFYRFAGKWRYVLIILLAGLLLLVTSGQKSETKVSDPKSDTESFDLVVFEAQLTDCISQIEGIGAVKVMLALDSTGREVYASDIRQSTSASYESTVSTVSNGSYGEAPVRVTTISPEFRGAVVVCEGAGNDLVRLAVTEAIGALCGLGADKISVIQMER